jgi:hypothetical protein
MHHMRTAALLRSHCWTELTLLFFLRLLNSLSLCKCILPSLLHSFIFLSNLACLHHLVLVSFTRISTAAALFRR